MRCRVCGKKMKFQQTIHHCRAVTDGLISPSPYQLKTEDLKLYHCTACSHMQIADGLKKDYYQDYPNSVYRGASQYFGALDEAEEKIKKLCGYAASHKKIVEIGCGEGKDLRYAKKYFSDCLGIEPSAAECELAKKTGASIRCGYFDKRLNLGSDFSAFMCFQVFEHLSDLYGVLDYAAEILEEGGVGLINVPNGQELLRRGAYHQFILEHINYYTPFSLTTAACRAGFDVISLDAVEKTMELDLYIRKREKPKCLDLCKQLQQEALEGYLADSAQISVWGAGAKAPVYSSLLKNPARIIHVLDTDESKSGNYISGISVPIEPVSQAALQGSDAVVIFASSYNDEIITDLRGKYGYTGKILYFNEDRVLEASAKENGMV